jgi:hypothetical protein
MSNWFNGIAEYEAPESVRSWKRRRLFFKGAYMDELRAIGQLRGRALQVWIEVRHQTDLKGEEWVTVPVHVLDEGDMDRFAYNRALYVLEENGYAEVERSPGQSPRVRLVPYVRAVECSSLTMAVDNTVAAEPAIELATELVAEPVTTPSTVSSDEASSTPSTELAEEVPAATVAPTLVLAVDNPTSPTTTKADAKPAVSSGFRPGAIGCLARSGT